jgi:ATP-dependent Clp protease ATP-binding subunit ClpA
MLLQVLCRRTKNNPLLLGEPGVGKTALVEGLAVWLLTRPVPAILRNREIFELHLGSLLAGTQYRGDMEKRLQETLGEIRRKRAIVFVDEIHLLVVAGRGSGMDAANLLKPILARGEVPCIGATTPTEAAEMFRVDPAMERRFQPITVEEPSRQTVLAILRAMRPRLETHHCIKISDAALETALILSLEGASRRKNPDRALDLLENACAALHLRLARDVDAADVPEEMHQAQYELERALGDLDLHRHVAARAALDQLQSAWSTRQTTGLTHEHILDGEGVRAAARRN